MKLFYLILFFWTLVSSSQAQLELPKLSPFQKIEQKVGVTDVTLEYSRPLMRDRKIFGELLQFGEYWRMGANKNTKISIGDKFIVEGDTIAAGTYALFAKINKIDWDVFFYSDTDNYGTPDSIEDSKILKTLSVPVQTINPTVKTLTYSFDDLTDSDFNLSLSWENVKVNIPISILTDDKIEGDIVEAFKSHAGDYFLSSKYYFEQKKDLHQAKDWIEQSISLRQKEAYWCYALQAEILAELGDKKGAVKAAQKTVELITPYKSEYHTNLYTELLNRMKAL